MRKTADKLKIYSDMFTGLTNAYGTYNSDSGRACQVKEKVTDKVFLNHLKGQKPYGVYLLVKDRTRAIAADFDTKTRLTPMEFVNAAKHYGISAYIEISKSKGHHVWIFFEKHGVLASKARMVVRHILVEMDALDTEVFPKQDVLDTNVSYGNFINAPLFGALVPQGKTVFVDPATFKPYPDQWDFLESVEKANESILDDIIEINDLTPAPTSQHTHVSSDNETWKSFSLPPCAQKMFQTGVSQFQRVSCFRLAVHLKRLGLPNDIATAALKTWAQKNHPEGDKKVLTELEIMDQASHAFKMNYRGYGCGSAAITPFCQSDCLVNKLRKKDDS